MEFYFPTSWIIKRKIHIMNNFHGLVTVKSPDGTIIFLAGWITSLFWISATILGPLNKHVNIWSSVKIMNCGMNRASKSEEMTCRLRLGREVLE